MWATAPRSLALSEHMVEFNIPSALIYQLKCQDVSERGVGVIVKPDSKFLGFVQVDQLAIRSRWKLAGIGRPQAMSPLGDAKTKARTQAKS